MRRPRHTPTVTAYAVCAVFLAAVLVVSGRAKLIRDPKVQESLDRARVPHSWYAPLAAAELAGAVGLLVGLAWRPLGVAAAVGVVLYFVGAVLAHLRARDAAGAPVPGVLLALAGVTLVLGVLSA